MRTRVELISESADRERIRQAGQFLTGLCGGEGADLVKISDAPIWIRGSFAPERTREESEIWLEDWHSAADKVAFERASGWTASNWLYWFSSANELWEMVEIQVDEGRARLILSLEHDDDPIPVEALRWFAIVAGLSV